MNDEREEVRRLKQLLTLVAREDEHLRAVRGRLFGSSTVEQIDGAWIEQTLAAPALQRARAFTDELHRAYMALKTYSASPLERGK